MHVLARSSHVIIRRREYEHGGHFSALQAPEVLIAESGSSSAPSRRALTGGPGMPVCWPEPAVVMPGRPTRSDGTHVT
jgi:hypothetical protein